MTDEADEGTVGGYTAAEVLAILNGHGVIQLWDDWYANENAWVRFRIDDLDFRVFNDCDSWDYIEEFRGKDRKWHYCPREGDWAEVFYWCPNNWRHHVGDPPPEPPPQHGPVTRGKAWFADVFVAEMERLAQDFEGAPGREAEMGK